MRLTPTTVLDMAFSFNSRAKYPTGASEVLSAAQAAITSDALIYPQIQVRSSDGFQVQYPDLFGKVFSVRRVFGQSHKGLAVYLDAVLAKPG